MTQKEIPLVPKENLIYRLISNIHRQRGHSGMEDAFFLAPKGRILSCFLRTCYINSITSEFSEKIFIYLFGLHFFSVSSSDPRLL
jgi:hypothetical protein